MLRYFYGIEEEGIMALVIGLFGLGLILWRFIFLFLFFGRVPH
jgi:hypothetical protein